MNRLVTRLLAGGLIGVAAAGTFMMMGRRRQRMMTRMMRPQMMRRRANKTLRFMRDGAFRLGSAFKSGTAAFASRLTERGSWGRA